MSDDDNPPPTTTTEFVMSPEQREVLNLALPGIRQFAANVPRRYAGSQVAGFTPSQVYGQNLALGAAPTVGGLAGTGADMATGWMSQDLNSRRDSTIDAATRPIREMLLEEALPAIRSEAVGSGNFGTSRQALAESGAIGRAARAVGDTASKVATDIYGTDVRASLQALGLLPQTQQAQFAEATGVSGVGDVQQQQQQRELDDMIAGFNYEQYAPFLQSREIMALLSGIPGGTNVSTGSVAQNKPGVKDALGGAAAGASLGTAIMPGVGTAAGAVGGAVLPFLFA